MEKAFSFFQSYLGPSRHSLSSPYFPSSILPKIVLSQFLVKYIFSIIVYINPTMKPLFTAEPYGKLWLYFILFNCGIRLNRNSALFLGLLFCIFDTTSLNFLKELAKPPFHGEAHQENFQVFFFSFFSFCLRRVT